MYVHYIIIWQTYICNYPLSPHTLHYSYGVVMWELLTGEKPYGNLNAFVVAYGVGRGTLSLPIPDSCPESFQSLMNGQSTRHVYLVAEY